jgi:Lon protease-like protein
MQPRLLPLFPLGLVLFPGERLPLHIFEDRYKKMIETVERSRAEFGVVLASEKGIANCGCTAAVDEVLRRYPDGRSDILAIGRRRFEINMVNDEEPYLRGDVYFYDDEDDALGDPETRRKLAEIGEAMGEGKIDAGDPKLSFALAQRISDTEVRQALLTLRSEAARIEHLAQVLPRTAAQRKLTETMRTLAPRNGHAKHLRGPAQS